MATDITVCKSTKAILQKADLDRDLGDEERAYVLYMRYFTMVQLIRKHRDYKKDKVSLWRIFEARFRLFFL
ncbi:hypothetical protein IscW_ISCW005312 [Ixodes scapularis]|uniref:USP8 dimerisation domain-containing protein n=1 Tax=Ixodes scapularis TaxID=6945 RepID=B7PNU1_IXOSC|nr:hypothetical protein IscW_ISCW005312 [Ixodes scapularis]|eukprot:XP_002435433.1 hypothetical protein IscW_ISCW005312 [Ixodes scapularis]